MDDCQWNKVKILNIKKQDIDIFVSIINLINLVVSIHSIRNSQLISWNTHIIIYESFNFNY